MKTCKKNMAIVLSFVLAAASIAMPSTESKAAKMKLNKSSVTVAVGKKVSLKVKGTTKKVSWTTSKKAIASVSKKGVVTGKKAGKATITAKVGAKKFRCKVTVKKSSKVKNVSTTKLASKCSFTVKKYKKGVLLSVKNNNSQMVDEVKANYILKTSSGVVVETGNVYFYSVGAGNTLEKPIYLTENEASSVDTSKCIVSCTAEQNYNNKHYINVNKSVSVSVLEATDVSQLGCSLKNNSSKDVSVTVCIYYYDNAGSIVDVDFLSESLSGKQQSFGNFSTPYVMQETEDSYFYVKGYTNYKIAVHAYTYPK